LTDSCPICSIPDREPILFSDGVVFLVKTMKMKGHNVRVMACTYRHVKEPSFDERLRMFVILYNYMSKACPGGWILCDGTNASTPDHSHYVACDLVINDEEKELLDKTEKTVFPLNKVMIGIPAHNEVKNIGKVIDGSKQYGTVVVYDDGSTDKTTEVSLVHGAHVLNPNREQGNRGYGYGLMKLFDYARDNGYQTLITIDGDGQHDSSDIINLLCALNNVDVVIGNRFLGVNNTPLYREVFIRGINFVTGVGDSQSGFRAYNRAAIEAVRIQKYDMGGSLDILTQVIDAGLSISEVPISIEYDDTEHSESPITQGYSLLETLFWVQIWGKPLTSLGSISLLAMLFGVIFGAMLVNEYYVYQHFALNLALLASGFIMASLVLLLACMFILVNRKILRELKIDKNY